MYQARLRLTYVVLCLAVPAVLSCRLQQQHARFSRIPQQQHMPLQQATACARRLNVHAALSGTSDGDHSLSSSEVSLVAIA
jgi:hypothetical protein